MSTAPSRSCRRSRARRARRSGELEVEALVGHANGDTSDAGPGVEPCAERPESRVIRGARKPGEAEGCSQKLAALVEQWLLDDLVRSQQQRLRDRQAQSFGGLQVDHQLELRRLLDWEAIGLCTL